MKKFLLKLINLFDKTAYICVECNKFDRGIGARIGYGWACSGKCYNEHADKMEKEDDGKRNT